MRIFFDNCIAVRFVDALRVLTRPEDGVDLVHLRGRFPEAIIDVDWIRTLGAEGGWIIVSGDLRITRSLPERAAWRESGLPAFFFDDAWASRAFWVQFGELVRWWPIVLREGRTASSGRGWRLPFKGKEPKSVR